MLLKREADYLSEMEAGLARSLDEITRCGIIFFKQAGPQNFCAIGESSSARDNPATEHK